MHAASVDLSFLYIYGYTVGCMKTMFNCRGKMGLHVGALGDTGAGKEPIFILYFKRLAKKQTQGKERFNFDVKTILTFSDL